MASMPPTTSIAVPGDEPQPEIGPLVAETGLDPLVEVRFGGAIVVGERLLVCGVDRGVVHPRAEGGDDDAGRPERSLQVVVEVALETEKSSLLPVATALQEL